MKVFFSDMFCIREKQEAFDVVSDREDVIVGMVSLSFKTEMCG